MVTPVVALTARRVSSVWGDPSAQVVSEIVQEVFLKLVEDERRILREFEDRGNEAFLKLLRMVAASVATDYHRRAKADKRGGRIGAIPLPSGAGQQEIHDGRATHAVEWPALMAQLDKLLRLNSDSVTDRDRQIFWLYYRQGLSAQAIAQIPAIELTAKGVESALRRMSQLLRDAVLRGKPAAGTRPAAEISAPLEKRFPTVIAINNIEPR